MQSNLMAEMASARGADAERAARESHAYELPRRPGFLRRLAERYWTHERARHEQPPCGAHRRARRV